MKKKIYLQLFAEGGDGSAGPSTATDESSVAATETGVEGVPPVAQKEDLSKVQYGKSEEQDSSSVDDNTTQSTEDIELSFDDLIKKGGKYHDDFNKRSQQIIDKRFKQVKEMESTLDSHKSILDAIANHYGVDATNLDAIQKAIDSDESFYEEAAYKEGLTTTQYREKLSMQRKLNELEEAQERQQQEQRTQEIVNQWVKESEALVSKYGIQNFDFDAEVSNPQFLSLLSSGVDFEGAYKAVHFDEMLGGAMQQTANNVSQAIANNITARQQRPSENSLSSQSHTVFKSDPSKFTDADLDEIERRVIRGEVIRF